MQGFGPFIRRQRETLRADDPRFSVRQLAVRIGVEPSYLSKVERELEPPPSEPKIRALANELGEDPDSLLARAGKVSTDLQEAICRRPRLLSKLIRELNNQPEKAVKRVLQDVQSGKTRGRADDRRKQ
jgi:transcriptional regulator with XRE-family HTH domain